MLNLIKNKLCIKSRHRLRLCPTCKGLKMYFADDKTVELKLFKDGNRWCVLEGKDLGEGIAGFGKTPLDAFKNYLKTYDQTPKRK